VQLLFLSGKELVDEKPFLLADRAILHIKDKREMFEQVTIHLICHQPQQDNLFRSTFSPIPVKVQQC
jgi:hypothetical protein